MKVPVLWPPDAKSCLLLENTLMLGKKWMTEDEVVGWHHRLDGHEFEQALGVGDGQGSLVCCSSWGHRESDMTQ